MVSRFAASPCLKKNSVNFIFSAKMVSLFHSLPLGGKLSVKQTDEGQLHKRKAKLFGGKQPLRGRENFAKFSRIIT